MKKKVPTKKKVAKAVKPRPAKAVGTRTKAPRKIAAPKPVGAVTHYFGKIKVAIIKFKQPVKVGSEIFIQGTTTDFTHKIISMQFDHTPITVAKKGQEVGIKVAKRVRPGDNVFLP